MGQLKLLSQEASRQYVQLLQQGLTGTGAYSEHGAAADVVGRNLAFRTNVRITK
jgi:hypothetical protein